MRTVRIRIENAIGSARDCGNVTEKEPANGIVKEKGITENLAVVIEIEDRGIIKAVAETDHIVIEAEIVIATETDIGIGENRNKNGDFFKILIDIIL